MAVQPVALAPAGAEATDEPNALAYEWVVDDDVFGTVTVVVTPTTPASISIGVQQDTPATTGAAAATPTSISPAVVLGAPSSAFTTAAATPTSITVTAVQGPAAIAPQPTSLNVAIATDPPAAGYLATATPTSISAFITQGAPAGNGLSVIAGVGDLQLSTAQGNPGASGTVHLPATAGAGQLGISPDEATDAANLLSSQFVVDDELFGTQGSDRTATPTGTSVTLALDAPSIPSTPTAPSPATAGIALDAPTATSSIPANPAPLLSTIASGAAAAAATAAAAPDPASSTVTVTAASAAVSTAARPDPAPGTALSVTAPTTAVVTQATTGQLGLTVAADPVTVGLHLQVAVTDGIAVSADDAHPILNVLEVDGAWLYPQHEMIAAGDPALRVDATIALNTGAPLPAAAGTLSAAATASTQPDPVAAAVATGELHADTAAAPAQPDPAASTVATGQPSAVALTFLFATPDELTAAAHLDPPAISNTVTAAGGDLSSNVGIDDPAVAYQQQPARVGPLATVITAGDAVAVTFTTSSTPDGIALSARPGTAGFGTTFSNVGIARWNLILRTDRRFQKTSPY